MNDDYLWDRSGEPEPEVQQLEELLGTLRYEPRPLQMPANLKIGRRLNYFRPMAIAATLVLFAVAISLWVNFNRRPPHVASEAGGTFETPATPSASLTSGKLKPAAPNDAPKSIATLRRHAGAPRALLAANRTRREPPPEPALTSDELAQKDQMLLALRLVSTKLNVAQRKLQGGTAPNVIRNQHKIG